MPGKWRYAQNPVEMCHKEIESTWKHSCFWNLGQFDMQMNNDRNVSEKVNNINSWIHSGKKNKKVKEEGKESSFWKKNSSLYVCVGGRVLYII